MSKIITGYADGGGSAGRSASVVERAVEDLGTKLKGETVQAITAHSDDSGLHLIAVCEGDLSSAGAKKKKGGK